MFTATEYPSTAWIKKPDNISKYLQLVEAIHFNNNEISFQKAGNILQKARVAFKHYASLCQAIRSDFCPPIESFWQIQVLTAENRYLKRHKTKEDKQGNNLGRYAVLSGLNAVKEIFALSDVLFYDENDSCKSLIIQAIRAKNLDIIQWYKSHEKLADSIPWYKDNFRQAIIEQLYATNWLEGIEYFDKYLYERIELPYMLTAFDQPDLMKWYIEMGKFPPPFKTEEEAQIFAQTILETELQYNKDFLNFGRENIPDFPKVFRTALYDDVGNCWADYYSEQSLVHHAATYQYDQIFECIVRYHPELMSLEDAYECSISWYAYMKNDLEFFNYVHSFQPDRTQLSGVHFYTPPLYEAGDGLNHIDTENEIPEFLVNLNYLLANNYLLQSITITEESETLMKEYLDANPELRQQGEPRYKGYLEVNKNLAETIFLLLLSKYDPDSYLQLSLLPEILGLIRDNTFKLYLNAERTIIEADAYPRFFKKSAPIIQLSELELDAFKYWLP